MLGAAHVIEFSMLGSFAGRPRRATTHTPDLLTYSGDMTVDFAFIEYSNDWEEWRLFAPARVKMSPLPSWWRSVQNGDDLRYVNDFLGSWGYRLAAEGWKQDGSRWVIAVQRREAQ
jgi:hypothetical protein